MGETGASNLAKHNADGEDGRAARPGLVHSPAQPGTGHRDNLLPVSKRTRSGNKPVQAWEVRVAKSGRGGAAAGGEWSCGVMRWQLASGAIPALLPPSSDPSHQPK